MADSDTLLAHLTGMLTSRIEDTASQALGYILRKSPKCREALDDLIRSGVKDVAAIGEVRNQSFRNDGTIPDLVGLDENRVERVLIEAKFRANLQPTQPVAYLNRLTENAGPTVLLFVVSEEKTRTLWKQFRDRLDGSGLSFSEADAERKCLQIGGTEKHLMVVSWAGLLDTLAARTLDGGDWAVEADIRQLRGLAGYAESEEFQPFSGGNVIFGSDEEAERRDRDLRQIIDKATDEGVNGGFLNRSGLNRAARPYGYGRYVRFVSSETIPWFGINRELYKQYGKTPLWLWFGPARDRKGYLNHTQYARIHKELNLTEIEGWVPISLQSDVELREVVEDVVSQLSRISELLSETP